MNTPSHQPVILPMKAALWPDLENLFGKRGACNGCWCMYWRIGPQYHKRERIHNKEDLEQVTSSNRFSGLLAFLGNIPVGWCQLTRREDLPWLLKNGYGSFNKGANVWCISCFYIKPGYRKMGITSALIHASIDHSREAGADLLEAYPRKSKGSFTGYPTTFEKVGFKIEGEGRYGRSIATYQFKHRSKNPNEI